jgi:two-component system OmpR family sensor kinase
VKWRKYLIIILPALAGLAANLLIGMSSLDNRVIYLRSDVGTFGLIGGLFISFVVWLVFRSKYIAERIRLKVLFEAREDRRRFLRRLDHELKNPLTAILAGLANLSLAENSPGNNRKLHQERKTTFISVEKQVKRLSTLVGDLRKLADLETRSLDFSPINLTEVIEEAYAVAKTLPGADKRNWSYSIPRAPWPLPEIRGDRDLLFLAFHNLLDNAVKFTRPNDMIELRAFEDNQMVFIEVADSGQGIPDEDIPHIWEELYRGEAARSIPGSGLGLSLALAIIKRHNGQVSISTRNRQGTKFTIKLPIKDGGRK